MNRTPRARGEGVFRGATAFSPRSLTFRVIAFSTIWAIVALIVIYTVIASLYRETSERGFDSLLSAHLFNLIGSVSLTETARLTGSPDLGDLRFSQPRSGWYWSVEPASEGVTGDLRSFSMTQALPSPNVADVPFSAAFQRKYQASGIAGEELQVLESEFVLDQSNHAARFRVTGNRSELERAISAFGWQLFSYLSLFGVGMVVINVVAILLGLRPLARVREALAKVREGTAQRLGGSFPTEIEPLANETNALIENNRRIVERSRTQVGNLAHSLKTPLAVLINEARALGGDKGRIMADQAVAMQTQLEYYLQRARIAAQRDSVIYRTPMTPLLQRMVRVMGKLNEHIEVSLSPPPGEFLFAGEKEDVEEIVGNLLDNAVKWARSKVSISLEQATDIDSQAMFAIVIEDDGPGIPDGLVSEVTKRGKRLDESKPGTGLGLAIVSDLVREYGGRIELGRAGLGGLKAVVVLRSVD